MTAPRTTRTRLGDRLRLRWGVWGLDWDRAHPIEGRSGWTLWLHGVPVIAFARLRIVARVFARTVWRRWRTAERRGGRP